jgi:putative ABC transport system permease protein
LQKYITDQISGLGSNLIFVIPGSVGGARTPGGQQANKLVLNDAKSLTIRLKDIAEVGPVVEKSVTVKYKNTSDKDTSILGTTANYPQIIAIVFEQGKFFTASQERSGVRVVAIGQTVKTKLFAHENPIGKKLAIAGNKYTVVGVAKARGSVFGMDLDNTVVVPISTAQRQFAVNNVNTIYISAKRPELVRLATQQAKTTLLKRLTEEDFSLQTQEQSLSTVSSIIGALTVALGGIAAISLVVGGIGVMNIMLVSVTERTREIGLRKALGAKRSDILKQFLFEAVILSVVGGVIGILLGVGASLLMAKFFISQVTPWSVVLAFGFSVAVGVIFGIAPAYRASRLSPIEALRYE